MHQSGFCFSLFLGRIAGTGPVLDKHMNPLRSLGDIRNTGLTLPETEGEAVPGTPDGRQTDYSEDNIYKERRP